MNEIHIVIDEEMRHAIDAIKDVALGAGDVISDEEAIQRALIVALAIAKLSKK